MIIYFLGRIIALRPLGETNKQTSKSIIIIIIIIIITIIIIIK